MSQEMDRVSAIASVIMLITWATPGIFIRFLPEMGALELGAWRLAPAVAPLAIMALFIPKFRAAIGLVIKRPITYFAALVMVAYFIFSNEGIRQAPIAIVALLICLAPLWVMIYELASGRTPTRWEFLGVILAFTGMFICISPGLSGIDERITTIGVLYALGASLLSASFIIAMRHGNQNSNHYTPLAVSFLIFTMGLPLLGLSYAIEQPYGFESMSLEKLLHALALSLFSTAAPTICYAILSFRLPPVVTALLNLLVPPCAAIAAWSILGESLSLLIIFGGAVSLLGLTLVVVKR